MMQLFLQTWWWYVNYFFKLISSLQIDEKFNSFARLKFTYNGVPHCQIKIGLYDEQCPNLVENFKALCLHTKKFGYVGSKVHRAAKNEFIQAGDFQYATGQGGYSIFGAFFTAEEVDMRILRGAVAAIGANGSKDLIGSGFIVALSECEHLEGKVFVFGRVVDGLDQLKALTGIQTDEEGYIIGDFVIAEASVGDFSV